MTDTGEVHEVRNDLEIWWHNCIDGCAPLSTQLKQSRFAAKQLQGLIELEEDGVIEITGGDSSPSSVWYRVLKRKEYDRRRGEWDLMSRFFFKEDDMVVFSFSYDPPEDWDYGKEHLYAPER